MHESHIIKPIIKGISKHAQKEGAKSVTRVRFKIGELTGVKENSFKEIFAVLARGTLLKDAELEVTFFPGSRIEVISFDIE